MSNQVTNDLNYMTRLSALSIDNLILRMHGTKLKLPKNDQKYKYVKESVNHKITIKI